MSADGSPINICLPYLPESVPEDCAFGLLVMGVGVYDALCLVACHLNYLSVACDIGNFQVECHSALLCALQVARPSELEVGLCNLEAVVGGAHDVDALACLGGEGIWGYEYAVALLCPTPYPSAQLVQL